jgi:hypothetical protein
MNGIRMGGSPFSISTITEKADSNPNFMASGVKVEQAKWKETG